MPTTRMIEVSEAQLAAWEKNTRLIQRRLYGVQSKERVALMEMADELEKAREIDLTETRVVDL